MAGIEINLEEDVKGQLPPANIDLTQLFNFTGGLQVHGDAVTAPPAAGVDGDITTITPDTAADAGVSAAFAPADHAHAIDCAAPSVTLTETGSAAEGSANSFLRSDAQFALSDLGREGQSALLANLRLRTAELHILPPDNGVIVNTGSGAQSGDVAQSGTPGMSVVVSACKGYTGPASSYARTMVPAGNQTVSLSAADATNPRYDAIVLPAGPGNVTPTKREGSPAGSPSLPTLTSGDILLSVVKVAANDTSITDAKIFNHRRYSNPEQRTSGATGDGSTVVFDLPYRIHGKPLVWRDGLRMEEGATATNDFYQVSEPVEAQGTRITFGAAPANGAVLRFDFKG